MLILVLQADVSGASLNIREDREEITRPRLTMKASVLLVREAVQQVAAMRKTILILRDQ